MDFASKGHIYVKSTILYLKQRIYKPYTTPNMVSLKQYIWD